MFGGTHMDKRHCHDFASEFSGLIELFDHRFWDNIDEEIDDRRRDDAFDARDFKTQGERAKNKDATMVLYQSKASDPLS